MRSTPREQRRAQQATGPAEQMMRQASQRHLDARQERLEAYATALEAALAEHPPGDQAARLEGQLDQARKEARAAARPRVPRGAKGSA
jgi:hypothetical protein